MASARSTVASYKSVILLLVAVLIANPAIVFLLTHSFWFSVAAPLATYLVLHIAYFGLASRLATIYIANFLAVISLFVHAEVILTKCFPDFVIDNLYELKDGYFFNKPNLIKHFASSEYAADFATNCQGFRIPGGQDPNTMIAACDWLFLGDSFTQGAQVPFEQLYTSMLFRRFPDKIILNAGMSGAGIPEEYNFYLTQGTLLSPSIVVLQVCSFNDFMNVQPPRKDLTDFLVHHSALLRLFLQHFRWQDPSGLPLSRWTEPFQKDHQANRDYNIFYREESPQKEADLENFKQYLQRLDGAVRNHGARLVVFLIPTKEQVDIDCFQEVIAAFQIRPAALDMLRPNTLLKQLTRELDIPFVDMLAAFRTSEHRVFFRYDEHLTAHGHAVIAEELAKILPAEHSPTLLSKDFSGERYPLYSSDGTKVTYQAPRYGNLELFAADAQWRSAAALTANDKNEYHPMLSHDGAWITFTEGDPNSLRTKVQIAPIQDINERKTITDGNGTFGAIPCFSPDDRLLAYAEWQELENGAFSHPTIVIRDLVTNETQTITSASHESWRPVFSPDGKRLVHIANPHGQFDLYLYQLDIKHEERITWTTFDEWDPRFSPDGRYIVYSAKPDGNWDLFVYDLREGENYRLTKTKGDEWDPSFSPRMDRVLYAGRFGAIQAIFSRPFAQKLTR